MTKLYKKLTRKLLCEYLYLDGEDFYWRVRQGKMAAGSKGCFMRRVMDEMIASQDEMLRLPKAGHAAHLALSFSRTPVNDSFYESDSRQAFIGDS